MGHSGNPRVISIRAHNDQLFILMYNQSYNQLAIPDVTNKRITLYTPAGEVIRHIQCAEIAADTNVSMCEYDDNSVIISCSCSPAQVFKFNLTSGAVEWTNTEIRDPTTVRCYGQYVLVSGACTKQTHISIIDSEAGGMRLH